ncbi:multiprotein-bridging factor 1 family protein [Streptomyces sp. NPDC001407]|uniref:helix-turn-helix domain-containing protein n=1 Tax=Streptomyces sp. NPDC001407 TaxID=3364573 RepID=UPI0036CAABEB
MPEHGRHQGCRRPSWHDGLSARRSTKRRPGLRSARHTREVINVARRRGARGFDGTVLRHTRELRRMSQEDLGRATGVSPSLVCAYEEGRRTPEWATLAAFATALSSTIGELRPGQPTTMEDLRCGAGQNQAAAAEAAGLGRSGYAMVEGGRTRSLKPDVARRLAAAWGVGVDEVVQAHAAAVELAGQAAPVLQGAVLEGLAGHFGVTTEALLELAHRIQDQKERGNS